jgi:hypothetical protein
LESARTRASDLEQALGAAEQSRAGQDGLPTGAQAEVDSPKLELEKSLTEVTRLQHDLEDRTGQVDALAQELALREQAAGLEEASWSPEGQRACHGAVQSFWAGFDYPTSSAHDTGSADDKPDAEGDPTIDDPQADAAPEPETGQVGEADAEEPRGESDIDAPPPEAMSEASSSRETGEAEGFDPDAPIEAEVSQAAAMKEALAAAKAELEAAENEPPPGVNAAATPESPPPQPDDAPVKFTANMADAARGDPKAADATDPATPDNGKEEELDLDPATAQKLKMLRRLKPDRSTEQLLAQISADQLAEPVAKPRRRWFSRK